MNMKKMRLAVVLLTTVALLGGLTGCEKKSDVSAVEENGVTTIKVAYQVNSYPLAYKTEDGTLTGYEIETMKLLDEELEDYKFEFVEGGTQEAQYTGLSSGKFDVVLSNAFYTEERAKSYNLPENPLGASVVGLVLPKEEDQIKDFETAAASGKKLAPILAGDGLYYVVYQYNQENQNQQINLEATDDANSFMNAISWVGDGRYDYAVWPKNYFEMIVSADDGELHSYNDKVQFVECRSVYTYPVISKDLTEFSAAANEGLGKIKETGKLSELSQQFYGYDAFAYESSN